MLTFVQLPQVVSCFYFNCSLAGGDGGGVPEVVVSLCRAPRSDSAPAFRFLSAGPPQEHPKLVSNKTTEGAGVWACCINLL